MKQFITKRRIFCVAVVIAVIIVPLLYSYFYLGAFWDPYSKLDKLPVAVVNQDKGAVINEKERNLGKEMCDRLKDDGSLKFIFTDERDAKAGTKGTKYYAAITIPENFSENIASADSDDPQPAEITYSPNEKRNYLASQILNRAVLEIEEETRSNIDKEIVQELTDNIKSVPDQLTELQDGFGKLGDGSSKLFDGTDALTKGTKTLLGGADKLAAGTGSLLNGADTLADGTGKLLNGTNTLADGADTLAKGTKSLAGGTNTFYNKMLKYKAGVAAVKAGSIKVAKGTKNLQSGINKIQSGATLLEEKTSNISQITDGAKSLADGTKAFDTGLAGYTAGVNSLITNVNNTSNFLAQYVKANPDLLKDPTFAAFIKKLSDPANAAGIEQLQGAAAKLTAASSALTQGAAQLSAGTQSLPDLNTALKTLSAGASAAKSGSAALTTGAGTLDAGVASLSTAAGQLSDAAGDIKDGAAKVNSGAGKLTKGIDTLESGAADLNSGAGKLSDGAAAVDSGANKLNGGAVDLNKGANDLKNGADQLNKGIADAKAGVDTAISDADGKLDKLDGLADYAAAPVSVEQKNVTSIANYGTAFAPYFMSLSLWVGALILFVGIYLDTEGRFKIMSRDSNHRVARSFLFLLVGFGQAIGLALIVKYGLGLKVDNVPLFYFSICLVSLVFIAMVQFFIVYLKSAGKLISIVMLILQLTSCGGTFPMETLPKFYNVLYPFMPMTYSVALFKQAITKTDNKAVAYNCGVLFAILIVFMALTIILSAVRAKKEKSERLNMPVQFEN